MVSIFTKLLNADVDNLSLVKVHHLVLSVNSFLRKVYLKVAGYLFDMNYLYLISLFKDLLSSLLKDYLREFVMN
jgi:hypothetical protein